MFPIASNVKLFTAVAAGLLVEEGRLIWDRPIKESVPAIQFCDSYLNNTVTLRDMHRTGITRHDTIWYKSNYSKGLTFRIPEFADGADRIHGRGRSNHGDAANYSGRSLCLEEAAIVREYRPKDERPPVFANASAGQAGGQAECRG